MESTERCLWRPLLSRRVQPQGMRGRRGRGLGSTTAATALLALVQRIIFTSLGTAWPAVFAQLSSETEASLRMSADSSACNTTLYMKWYESPYSGALLVDLVDFWIFSDAELTNGQALETVSSLCGVMMETLRLDRAGRNGPVQDKYIYDIMCANECTLSDAIREDAMESSSCTCLELSTQPTDPTYHTEGDWCVANSGSRILCETFGQCGKWDCRISDFMCPRYEYDKQVVPHRGKGDCSGARGRGGRGPRDQHATTAIPVLLACVALLAFPEWHNRR
ncbi:unnamed protein product [Hapterophycus canaliculatus]